MKAAIVLATVVLGLSVSTAWAVTLKPEAQRKRAPNFELKDAQGKTVQLAEFSGKVVLLDFWATWCAPCKSAMPWINELAEKYRSEGFEVVGISMDEQGWEVVNPFLAKVKVNYPILMGTRRVAYLYGDVESLPLMFFLDRQQRIAAIHVGAASRKDFEKTLKQLLATEKP